MSVGTAACRLEGIAITSKPIVAVLIFFFVQALIVIQNVIEDESLQSVMATARCSDWRLPCVVSLSSYFAYCYRNIWRGKG